MDRVTTTISVPYRIHEKNISGDRDTSIHMNFADLRATGAIIVVCYEYHILFVFSIMTFGLLQAQEQEFKTFKVTSGRQIPNGDHGLKTFVALSAFFEATTRTLLYGRKDIARNHHLL